MSPVARLTLLMLAYLMSLAVVAADGQAPAVEGEPSLIDRFLIHDQSPLREYRARRTLRAVNTRFHARATLEAITELTRDGTFRYEIVREEGSGSVRSKVLRAVLRDEQRLWQRGDPQRSRLSADNYTFRTDQRVTEDGVDESAAVITITPRRRDVLLIDGRIVVDAETGDLRRVEGRLTKSPSFWTSRVEVVRRYARISGVRVPVATTSVAHVKIAGRSEFEMTYDYESINGERVQAAPPSAP